MYGNFTHWNVAIRGCAVLEGVVEWHGVCLVLGRYANGNVERKSFVGCESEGAC